MVTGTFKIYPKSSCRAPAERQNDKRGTVATPSSGLEAKLSGRPLLNLDLSPSSRAASGKKEEIGA